jgi:hypothetical protein
MDLPEPDAPVIEDFHRLQQRLDATIEKLRSDQMLPPEPVPRFAVITGVLDELYCRHPETAPLIAAAALDRLVSGEADTVHR